LATDARVHYAVLKQRPVPHSTHPTADFTGPVTQRKTTNLVPSGPNSVPDPNPRSRSAFHTPKGQY
jgi:hypothetical protein